MPARPAPPTPSVDEPTPGAPRRVPSASLPPRGRHVVGVARIPLCRITLLRKRVDEIHPGRRIDRRREQLPLPPGFIDRRAA